MIWICDAIKQHMQTYVTSIKIIVCSSLPLATLFNHGAYMQHYDIILFVKKYWKPHPVNATEHFISTASL